MILIAIEKKVKMQMFFFFCIFFISQLKIHKNNIFFLPENYANINIFKINLGQITFNLAMFKANKKTIVVYLTKLKTQNFGLFPWKYFMSKMSIGTGLLINWVS